ncbi:methyltransferase domain-containing protein [Actinokineospora xionganensis]|uniref:Methyltransferase domain-containing protein n=1 Tax=Actinokineospora xionganensis TaxID=2684470 RepID=A0ABR7KZ24_9PSEU|nr:methyltransferase domain-containing protein [Actinokineospora xionganensis]MBC6445693.1 methyltransferase domain-containing protein [Actinokineospora xionganensis]
MSSSTEAFQISAEQAALYEAKFVPALFADWAPPFADAAGLEPGQAVLDVACGTGILARTAADRVGPTGKVVGLDLNEGMLTVARGLRSDIEWRQGNAADLPFPDGSFDAVLCQSALMFFPDATQALREMGRVCAPDGTVGVQVYAGLDDQPAYRPWVELVARHAGPEAFSLLGAYWVHGDLDILRARFHAAGLDVAEIRTRTGTARWDSVDEMVRVEVESTPLIDRLTDAVYQRVLEESREVLGQYRTPAGAEIPIKGHLVTARGRSRD